MEKVKNGEVLRKYLTILAKAPESIQEGWQTFFDFLTEHNALESFFRNRFRGLFHCGIADDETILADPQSQKDWIKGSFIWSRTEEGFEYWSELDSEWSKYIELASLKKAQKALEEEALELEKQIKDLEGSLKTN